MNNFFLRVLFFKIRCNKSGRNFIRLFTVHIMSTAPLLQLEISGSHRLFLGLVLHLNHQWMSVHQSCQFNHDSSHSSPMLTNHQWISVLWFHFSFLFSFSPALRQISNSCRVFRPCVQTTWYHPLVIFADIVFSSVLTFLRLLSLGGFREVVLDTHKHTHTHPTHPPHPHIANHRPRATNNGRTTNVISTVTESAQQRQTKLGIYLTCEPHCEWHLAMHHMGLKLSHGRLTLRLMQSFFPCPIMTYTGASLVLRGKFSATHFWEDCRRHNVTIIQYIGEMCRYLCLRPKVSTATCQQNPGFTCKLNDVKFC